VGSPLYPFERDRLERRLAPARRTLGSTAGAIEAAGMEMGLERAIAEALSMETPQLQPS
jgi:hypothetical protein